MAIVWLGTGSHINIVDKLDGLKNEHTRSIQFGTANITSFIGCNPYNNGLSIRLMDYPRAAEVQGGPDGQVFPVRLGACQSS